MQIVEPTEKAFVLSAREKETLKAAACIVEELCNNITKGIEAYSHEYDSVVFNPIGLGDISDYLNYLAAAETITERS